MCVITTFENSLHTLAHVTLAVCLVRFVLGLFLWDHSLGCFAVSIHNFPNLLLQVLPRGNCSCSLEC